jgi:hypothetical protein
VGESCTAVDGDDQVMVSKERPTRLTFDLRGRRHGGVRLEVVYISGRNVCTVYTTLLRDVCDELQRSQTYIRQGILQAGSRGCANDEDTCLTNNKVVLTQ